MMSSLDGPDQEMPAKINRPDSTQPERGGNAINQALLIVVKSVLARRAPRGTTDIWMTAGLALCHNFARTICHYVFESVK